MAAENIAQLGSTNVSQKGRSLGAEAWSRLIKNKAAVAGMIVISVFAIISILAPVFAPHNPLEIFPGKSYLPPPWYESDLKDGDPRFFFGTDSIGRDVLSRLIYGTRVSMVVGLIPTIVILLIGTGVGMVSGYFGGNWDVVLMRITDVIYAFPDILFFIIVMVAMREEPIGQFMNGLFLLFMALAIVNWVGVARLVRGQVLSLKQKEFVEAARCIGAKDSRIMFRHILPNSLGPLTVSAAFTVPGLIISEAILGFLGLGLRPATQLEGNYFITSWGSLLLDGYGAINSQPFILLPPALCIAVIVLSFTFLGDGLRDALDPRMRGSQ
jgi:ABC-type dipeptide/oligopeptide/nickel transport system permease subunit